MTRISILLATLVLLAAGSRAEPRVRFTVTDASALWVTGTSSLHDWRCDAGQVTGWLELDGTETVSDISSAEITAATSLECKNGTMDRKTRGALKADDHPAIRFAMTSAEMLSSSEDRFEARVTGELTIAGEARSVATNVAGMRTDEGGVHVTGELPVTMTDFGVDPPRAMLGTLKTGDDVTVHFELVAVPLRDL